MGLLGPLANFRHSLDMGETWKKLLTNATSDSDNLVGEADDDDVLHGKSNYWLCKVLHITNSLTLAVHVRSS